MLQTDLSPKSCTCVGRRAKCSNANVKVPKDFPCNMSLCWCIVFVSVFSRSSLESYTSLVSLGILFFNRNLFKQMCHFPIESQKQMLFSYGLNCVISLSLLATTTHTHHASSQQMSNVRLGTFRVTAEWASVPVSNDAEKNGSGLQVSAKALSLFTESSADVKQTLPGISCWLERTRGLFW